VGGVGMGADLVLKSRELLPLGRGLGLMPPEALGDAT
jgi:hypothetical protein